MDLKMIGAGVCGIQDGRISSLFYIRMVEEGCSVLLVGGCSNSWVSGWYELELIVFSMAGTGLHGKFMGLRMVRAEDCGPQDGRRRI